jgi:hypothetical protein
LLTSCVDDDYAWHRLMSPSELETDAPRRTFEKGIYKESNTNDAAALSLSLSHAP